MVDFIPRHLDPKRIEYEHGGIYFAFSENLIRVGSTYRPNNQKKTLRSLKGEKIESFLFVSDALAPPEFINMREWEKAIHNQFIEYHVGGKWFLANSELTDLIAALNEPAHAYMLACDLCLSLRERAYLKLHPPQDPAQIPFIDAWGLVGRFEDFGE